MFLISAREASSKITEKVIEMLDMRYDMPTATVKNVAKTSDDPDNAIRMALEQSLMLIVVIDPDWLQNPDEPNLNPHDRKALNLALKSQFPMVLVFVDGAGLPNPLPEDLRGLDALEAVTVSSMLAQSGMNTLAQIVAPSISDKKFTPIIDSDAVVAAGLSTEEREQFFKREPIVEAEEMAVEPVVVTSSRKISRRAIQLVAFSVSLVVIVMMLILIFDSLKR
ncbi:MAG: hypothetical protein KJ043_02105 [Anaerolineae bacterium]|nr:hypothetical protein [Anaerolineae bacterium]